jgi:hypothetical protein
MLAFRDLGGDHSREVASTLADLQQLYSIRNISALHCGP